MQAATVPATVTYTTTLGNTIPGDFDGGTGTVTIPPGSTIREFDLKIPTHAIAPAGSRIFDVTISNPQGARLDQHLAPCTIVSSGSGSLDPAVRSRSRTRCRSSSPRAARRPVAGHGEVERSGRADDPVAVHVHWTTVDGTADGTARTTRPPSGDLTWAGRRLHDPDVHVQVNSNPALVGAGSLHDRLHLAGLGAQASSARPR